MVMRLGLLSGSQLRRVTLGRSFTPLGAESPTPWPVSGPEQLCTVEAGYLKVERSPHSHWDLIWGEEGSGGR